MRETDANRIAVAMERIHDAKVQAEIVRAVEAMADAKMLIATGTGAAEVQIAGGFESTQPGPISVMAATVWREGRRSFKDVSRHGQRLLDTLNKRRSTDYYPIPNSHGRPTVLTPALIQRASDLRMNSGRRVTPVLRQLSAEFGPSASALWACLEKGRECEESPIPGPPDVYALFHRAVYTTKRAIQ